MRLALGKHTMSNVESNEFLQGEASPCPSGDGLSPFDLNYSLHHSTVTVFFHA
jgi:hypothetical protein